jgi:hypothetical protein
MKSKQVSSVLGTLGLACGCLFAVGQPARADINYAIDSFNDGYNSGVVGSNSAYEFYGMAIVEDGNNIIVALNANMPLTGVNSLHAQDGLISWGDLFFNFSSDNYNTASSNSSLYAIHFADTNNSGVSTLGIYSNVTGKSVTSINSGFNTLSSYNIGVQNAGGTPSLAQLPANTSYFNQGSPIQNVINTGNFVTGINMLSATQLSGLGFDFGQFGATGTQTFGFSFDKNALPVGEFIASIFAECINDGMVIVGKTDPRSEDVPEPLSILGSMAGVGLILRRQKGKRNQPSSVD